MKRKIVILQFIAAIKFLITGGLLYPFRTDPVIYGVVLIASILLYGFEMDLLRELKKQTAVIQTVNDENLK